jgi:hypothetical protein
VLVRDVVDDHKVELAARHLFADGFEPSLIFAEFKRQGDHVACILFYRLKFVETPASVSGRTGEWGSGGSPQCGKRAHAAARLLVTTGMPVCTSMRDAACAARTAVQAMKIVCVCSSPLAFRRALKGYELDVLGNDSQRPMSGAIGQKSSNQSP